MEKTIFISGPDPTLELAYPDVWLPNLYSRRVFVFQLQATSSYERAIDVLEKALQALVLGLPELGSETHVTAGVHDKSVWRTLKPYRGLEFVVKDYRDTFPSFSNLERQSFPLTVFEDQLLMPIPSRIEGGPQPQAKIQVTLIDGGLLLSTCFLHHLADGTGMNTITRTLAQCCKQATESDPPLAPVDLDCDRSPLQTLESPQTDLAHHPAYRYSRDQWLPRLDDDGDEEQDPTITAPTPSPFPAVTLPGYFRLTPSAATRLRADAQATTGSNPGPRISTHDGIVALIWLTLIRARHALGRLRATETTTFAFPHNVRRQLGLAPAWVGNCVYFCVAQARVSELLADAALPTAAAKIRAVLAGVDRPRVAGLMAARREHPFSLSYWAGEAPDDMAVVSVTSFYHSELLALDWGPAWGPVRHFTTTNVGPLAKGYERTAFVGPKLQGVLGCDVMVGADEEEVEFMRKDELWNRYFGHSRL